MCENQEVNLRSPKLYEKTSPMRRIPTSPKQTSHYAGSNEGSRAYLASLKNDVASLVVYNEKTKKIVEEKKKELIETRSKNNEKIQEIKAANEANQKRLIQENQSKIEALKAVPLFEHENLLSIKNETASFNKETEQLRNDFQQSFNNFMNEFQVMKEKIEESARRLTKLKAMKKQQNAESSEIIKSNEVIDSPALVQTPESDTSKEMVIVQKLDESLEENLKAPQRKSRIVEFIEKFCKENAEWLS